MSVMRHHIHIPDVKKVIGIISGKGGVGKSFVTTNLALGLAKMGALVGVMDADVGCPNQFKLFGINEKLNPNPDRSLTPIEKWGVKVVSMSGLCSSEDEAIIWRGPIVSKIVRKLLQESSWGKLDFLLIDFPPGTSDATLTILQEFAMDGVVLVTTPQKLVTIDVRRAAHMAQILEISILGVIENMRSDIFGEGGGVEIANKTHITSLGSIPLRKQIVEYCDQGTPALFHMDELDSIFSKIARSVVEQVYGPLPV